MAPHIPVLLQQTLQLLAIQPGDTVVDATAGAGGHLRRIIEAVGPTGRVIALDRDERAHQPDAAAGVVAQAADRAELVRASFAEMEEVLQARGIEKIDAVLADLGVSSMQLDEGTRGFSFRFDAPLDMRMDTRKPHTAFDLLQILDEEELANVIYEYGEERLSRRISRSIKRALLEGSLSNSTASLADLVQRTVGKSGRIHPATQTFQALRIAVNQEFEQLDQLLALLPRVLIVGGRAGIISFHSLEDRRVKQAFRDDNWLAVTKHPVVADEEECAVNPRSRSAKLRVARRADALMLEQSRKKNKYAHLKDNRNAADHEEDDESDTQDGM